MSEQKNELTETTHKPKSALASMAARMQVSQSNLVNILKATVFKDCRSDEEFAALLIVANEHRLNPLKKEIYAFPARGGGVVPIVSIDGWLRIINDQPQFDGIDEELAEDGSWCKISIYRKDRTRPVVHTEWMAEVKRNTDPWKQHPRRMLKWKTIIQAGRIAFGLGGIYDEDEGRTVAGESRAANHSAPPSLTTNPFAKKTHSPERPEEPSVSPPPPESNPESGTLPTEGAATTAIDDQLPFDDDPGSEISYVALIGELCAERGVTLDALLESLKASDLAKAKSIEKVPQRVLRMVAEDPDFYIQPKREEA